MADEMLGDILRDLRENHLNLSRSQFADLVNRKIDLANDGLKAGAYKRIRQSWTLETIRNYEMGRTAFTEEHLGDLLFAGIIQEDSEFHDRFATSLGINDASDAEGEMADRPVTYKDIIMLEQKAEELRRLIVTSRKTAGRWIAVAVLPYCFILFMVISIIMVVTQ